MHPDTDLRCSAAQLVCYTSLTELIVTSTWNYLQLLIHYFDWFHLHFNAEVKNAWSYTSTPQYAFMAWYIAKYSYNFVIYLCLLQFKFSNYVNSRYFHCPFPPA
jgi:hypothetical protein